MKQKIAIVCDWLVSRGGAERVIKTISDMFPRAPIFTSVYSKNVLPEFADRQVISSFIQKLPFSSTKHHIYLPLMPYAFEQMNLADFEIVISSSHSCAKGIITKPSTMHVCYCHSPMRYAWNSCHEYFEQYGIPPLLRRRAKKILHELRLWDRLAAERVDFFIANSNHVKNRIWKYYRKQADVIYPPVETEQFGSDSKTGGFGNGQYYLAVGRLTPYKRFDLLVDVFNDLKMPLVIAGTGKEEKKLRKKASRFVTLLGAVSDDDLADIYKRCIALVFPQVEDFGIIPVEAMSCGKPVIALSRGGALETVIPGKTGLFFDEQTPQALKKIVLEFSAIKWDSDEIKKHAQTFDRKIFEEKLRQFIEEKWAVWKKEMII